MKIIRDNVYLFSLARMSVGEVVACRARDGYDAIGKNIGDLLHIDKKEIEYAISRSDIESYRSLCLVCHPNRESRVVALFDFLSRSSSLMLAVVFDINAVSVSRALGSLGEGFADLSPTLVQMGEGCPSSPEADRDAFVYVSHVYGCIAPLSFLRAGTFPDNPESLRKYVDGISDLVGVDVCFVAQTDPELFPSNEKGMIFSGGYLVACFLTVAMLSRRYSIDRRLEITVLQGRGELLVKMRFETDDVKIVDGLGFLSAVSDSLGTFFEHSIVDDRGVEITVMPTYADVGLVGVKERDELPKLSDFYEYGNNI